jgi:hypothetical protein
MGLLRAKEPQTYLIRTAQSDTRRKHHGARCCRKVARWQCQVSTSSKRYSC